MQSDQELVQSFRNGNERAIEILIRRHQARVYSQLIAKVKDPVTADDLFQETFIKIIRSLKSTTYSEEGKFLPWALRVANNTALDHFRKVKRSKEIVPDGEFTVFDTYGEVDKSEEDKVIALQVNSDLHKLIEYLPESQREVLRLRLFCEYSFKEIAEETDVSINTALGRMRYAVINLQKLMAEHNISLSAY